MANRRPRSLQSASQEDESLLNLTPLIDVVFVVLIIFILIAPMLEVDKVSLSSSEEANLKSASTSSPIAIHVHADNTVWLNNNKVSLESLPSLLRKERQKHLHQVPQLFHDKKAHFGTYQTIKNAAEGAGYEELDVILLPGSS